MAMLWEASDRRFDGGFVDSGKELTGVSAGRPKQYRISRTHRTRVTQLLNRHNTLVKIVSWTWAIQTTPSLCLIPTRRDEQSLSQTLYAAGKPKPKISPGRARVGRAVVQPCDQGLQLTVRQEAGGRLHDEPVSSQATQSVVVVAAPLPVYLGLGLGLLRHDARTRGVRPQHTHMHGASTDEARTHDHKQ